MTLDELIDHLRRIRAAFPDMASQQAHIWDDRNEDGAERPVIDIRAHTTGVVISSMKIRRHPPVPACGDDYLAEYERKRGLT